MTDQVPLPEPALPDLAEGYGIVVGGVGGTGVVTIGALLGMAAHLEGKGAAVLDMTGLAQKGGAVMSHLRIAKSPAAIQTVRIAPGGARLLLGCDLVVAGGKEALAALAPERGHAVVNTHEMMTGDFTRNADFSLPAAALRQAIEQTAGERARFVPATRLASALLGDAIATNLFMVGFAYQQGLLPVSAAAIERAIEINRVAVAMNRSAFRWGRRAALDLAAVEAAVAPATAVGRPAVADAGRADRAARGAPYGLSGRRLRGPLPPAGRARARAPMPRSAAARSAKRSPATMPSCWPTRTSTRSRGSIRTAPSWPRSVAASRAGQSSSCIWRRRSWRRAIR